MREDSKAKPPRAGDRPDESPPSEAEGSSQIETLVDSSTTGAGSEKGLIEGLIREVLPLPGARLERRRALAEGGMGKIDVVLDLAF